MAELKTERVTISVKGNKMGGYLARPTDGKPAPAVLVFQEIFGVNSHIRDVTERVAREGYVALAPDFFWRVAPGVDLGYDEEGFGKGMQSLASLKADEILADVSASIAFLRERPDVRGDRLGCMGFCIGGHVAYLAACETDVRATASFYGGGVAVFCPGGGDPTVLRTPKIRGEVLCLFGEKDGFIPMDQVETVRNALGAAKVKHEVVVYANADHGFFCDQRETFQREARDDAWKRVRGLFARTLQG